MSLGLKDLDTNESNKTKKAPSTKMDVEHDRTRVLRPWESFETQEDLLEIITNRQKKSTLVKKGIYAKKKNLKENPVKELQNRIKSRAKDLFKNSFS